MAQDADNSTQGRYMQYKAGTATIVRWLVDTASSRCDFAKIIAAGDHSSKGRKSRTKASIKQPVQIRFRDLAPLAVAIVSVLPPIDIPKDKLTVLRKVIAGREACAGWYASQTADGNGNVANRNATTRTLHHCAKASSNHSHPGLASPFTSECEDSARREADNRH